MRKGTLTDGTIVWCRRVPPYAYTDMLKKLNRPKFPVLEIESADGHVEKRPALEGSPELEAYHTEMKEFTTDSSLAMDDFRLAYGVARWQKPGDDKPTESPPSGWKAPAILATFGVKVDAEDTYTRRVQYIKYELLQTEEDESIVDGLIDVQTVSAKEVEAASVPLRSATE